MKHQKTINLLEKSKKKTKSQTNQPPKFRTKNWVEIHYGSRGMYNTNTQI